MADDAPAGPGRPNAPRALHVLETLATMAQPAALPALVARTGLAKSTVYRTLRELQSTGFVDHRGRGGYSIGGRSFALASLIGPPPPVRRRSRPMLSKLADLAGAGAALHLRSGEHRVLISAVVPRRIVPQMATVQVPIGERAPLTSGCAGMAILAFLSAEEAARIIDSRPPGEPRPTAAGLQEIREAGYAVSFSANHPHLNGIAAPLLDPLDAAPLGSLAIAAPDDRLDERALRRLSEPLRAVASQQSRVLAKLLGTHDRERRAALDVTIQQLLHG